MKIDHSKINDIQKRKDIRQSQRADAGERERDRDREGGGGHGNTKLPYGIAKGMGIETTGLSPKEVWKALKGEGVSPKKAYEAVKQGKTGKEVQKAATGKSTTKSKSPVTYKIDPQKELTNEVLEKMHDGDTIKGEFHTYKKNGQNWDVINNETGEVEFKENDSSSILFYTAFEDSVEITSSDESFAPASGTEVHKEEKKEKKTVTYEVSPKELTKEVLNKMNKGATIQDEYFTYKRNGKDWVVIDTADGTEFNGMSQGCVMSMIQGKKKVEVSVDDDAFTPSPNAVKKGEKIKEEKKQELNLPPEIKETVLAKREQFDKAKKYESPQEADDDLRRDVGMVWSQLSSNQQVRIAAYTGSSYEDINNSLIGKYDSFGYVENMITDMTDMIDKVELKKDTVLYRGVGNGGFSNMFGLDTEAFEDMNPDELIGMVGTNDGFSSCGTVKGKGFTHKPVQMRILCPKGTKAAYAEPWSDLGNGAGSDWDGRSPQSSFSSEDETILQRGSSFQIVNATRKNGKLMVDVAIVGQDPKPIDILRKEHGWQ